MTMSEAEDILRAFDCSTGHTSEDSPQVYRYMREQFADSLLVLVNELDWWGSKLPRTNI